jgi:chromate reductase
MRILAISGSLRAGSHNTRLLRAAAAIAPEHVDLELYDGLREIPPYDADDDVANEPPEAVRRFKAALEEADAVLIATPEYNSSMPGVLKNALDWASRPVAESPVRGKPVAVLSASTGMFGAVWAAAETRKVMGALGARTLEETLALPRAHESVGDGFEPSQLDALRNVVAELAAAVETRQSLRSAA